MELGPAPRHSWGVRGAFNSTDGRVDRPVAEGTYQPEHKLVLLGGPLFHYAPAAVILRPRVLGSRARRLACQRKFALRQKVRAGVSGSLGATSPPSRPPRRFSLTQ